VTAIFPAKKVIFDEVDFLHPYGGGFPTAIIEAESLSRNSLMRGWRRTPQPAFSGAVFLQSRGIGIMPRKTIPHKNPSRLELGCADYGHQGRG